MKKFLCTLPVIFALTRISLAEPPELNPAKDLPRFPAVEAKDSLKIMQIKKGFHAEIAASEPLIQSPIAMCFDENGRLFVCEMIGYSERRDDNVCKIVMLEDTDGDGTFDKSTIFVDGLA